MLLLFQVITLKWAGVWGRLEYYARSRDASPFVCRLRASLGVLITNKNVSSVRASEQHTLSCPFNFPALLYIYTAVVSARGCGKCARVASVMSQKRTAAPTLCTLAPCRLCEKWLTLCRARVLLRNRVHARAFPLNWPMFALFSSWNRMRVLQWNHRHYYIQCILFCKNPARFEWNNSQTIEGTSQC